MLDREGVWAVHTQAIRRTCALHYDVDAIKVWSDPSRKSMARWTDSVTDTTHKIHVVAERLHRPAATKSHGASTDDAKKTQSIAEDTKQPARDAADEWDSGDILGFGQIDFTKCEQSSAIATATTSTNGSTSRSNNNNDGIAEIGALYVHPDAQRMGVGRAIMAALLHEAQQRYTRGTGVTRLQLDASTNGIPFYDACGFIKQGEPMIHYFGGTNPPVGVHAQRMIYTLK